MATKIGVLIRFAMNMCAVDPAEMPENGMIVVPAQGSTWYGICSTAALSGYLSQRMSASPERPVEGYNTCRFNAGGDHTPAQLKYHLEQAGFVVNFANNPPWLQK